MGKRVAVGIAGIVAVDVMDKHTSDNIHLSRKMDTASVGHAILPGSDARGRFRHTSDCHKARVQTSVEQGIPYRNLAEWLGIRTDGIDAANNTDKRIVPAYSIPRQSGAASFSFVHVPVSHPRHLHSRYGNSEPKEARTDLRRARVRLKNLVIFIKLLVHPRNWLPSVFWWLE